MAILGGNGAGKSTLLRMFATLTPPDSGTLAVAGHALPTGAAAARGRIGYLGHDPFVYLDLTCAQNLEFFADLHGVDRSGVPALLDRVGLAIRTHDRVRTLSRGMTQRLGLARVMLNTPSLYLLDEPHASLDEEGQVLLDEIIGGVSGDRTVVLVTHERDRAERLADRILTIANGVLVA